MSKIIVIYHKADFDGIFCREIARKFLPAAELIGWDYGDPTPHVPEDARLYMLDISVEGLMHFPGLVWIDHHKSAMEKYPTGIPGYRIDGVAACRLAWQCFYLFESMAVLPDKEQFIYHRVREPLAVRLAGEYDVWDKRDPNAELFQHGLRSMDLEPHWGDLLSIPKANVEQIEELMHTGHLHNLLNPDGTMTPPIVWTLLDSGKAVQYAQTEQNKSIIEAAGFTVEFERLKFLACNHARYNSHLFTAGLKPEHDACLGFCWRDGQWVVSLYHAPGKEHHDLSQIAVKHGGGGHRGACGFRMKSLPFLT